jgi:Cu/Ag efflux pump CusA
MKNQLEKIKERLPGNVKVETVYDRTELVDFVIDTVRSNLFEGGLLVIAILFMFLGNLRAAFIVALAIPLSMLFAFSGMLHFGIAASLLSLGAIDFGMVVDSSVVMIENCVRPSSLGQFVQTSCWPRAGWPTVASRSGDVSISTPMDLSGRGTALSCAWTSLGIIAIFSS